MKKILSIKDVDQLSIKKVREYYKKFFNSGIEKFFPKELNVDIIAEPGRYFAETIVLKISKNICNI